MANDGMYKMDKQKNAVVLERVGEGRIMLELRKKRKIRIICWLRGNARDSHSGGPGFKTRGRPTWLRF